MTHASTDDSDSDSDMRAQAAHTRLPAAGSRRGRAGRVAGAAAPRQLPSHNRLSGRVRRTGRFPRTGPVMMPRSAGTRRTGMDSGPHGTSANAGLRARRDSEVSGRCRKP